MRCKGRLTLVAVVVAMLGCDGERIVTPFTASDRFQRTVDENESVNVIDTRPPSGPSARVGSRRVPPAPQVAERAAVQTLANLRPADLYTNDYQASTVITVRGPVVGLNRVSLADDRTGLLAEINVGGEFPRIYLGPEQWLWERDLRPAITNQLVVTGSRVAAVNGPDIIIAREATIGDVTVVIRDESGAPRYPVPAAVNDTKSD